MDILLANPRGFCAGVDRAIEIVERALAMFGAPIYVRHEMNSMKCRMIPLLFSVRTGSRKPSGAKVRGGV